MRAEPNVNFKRRMVQKLFIFFDIGLVVYLILTDRLIGVVMAVMVTALISLTISPVFARLVSDKQGSPRTGNIRSLNVIMLVLMVLLTLVLGKIIFSTWSPNWEQLRPIAVEITNALLVAFAIIGTYVSRYGFNALKAITLREASSEKI